ncbi:hypothetical protein [Oceanisphaera profunda]|nr:hypothetical protein [Oceanisphaera profunda]
MMKFSISAVFSFTALAILGAAQAEMTNPYKVVSISTVSEQQSIEQADDVRAYMHGINLAKRADGHYDLIWSAASDEVTKEGNWNHDIYTSTLNAQTPAIQAIRTLISAPEAQEPVSVSQTKNGMRMYTFEDGNQAKNQVAQRFAIFDEQGHPVKQYPQTVKDGGHSGHTASTNEQHVIFWSDDWIEGGGVDNLGSGKEVWVTAYTASGNKLHTKKITTLNNQRDWWPMIAASADRTMLVWQRFVEGETYAELMGAIYDPKTNKLIKQPIILNKNIQYYTYEVSYIESIKSFVVSATTHLNKGVLYVINENAMVTAKKQGLKAFVREAHPAIKLGDKKSELMYPTAPTGFALFEVNANSISMQALIEDSYEWQYSGTVGFYTLKNDVYFASLSKEGVIEKLVRKSH